MGVVEVLSAKGLGEHRPLSSQEESVIVRLSFRSYYPFAVLFVPLCDNDFVQKVIFEGLLQL